MKFVSQECNKTFFGVLFLRVIGVVCIISGSTLWQARLDFTIERALTSSHYLRAVPLETSSTTDLSSSCNLAVQDEGWILFFLTAQLKSDDKYRGLFETAADEKGLYLDYLPQDGGLIRAGITMEEKTDFIPIRVLRQDEEVLIAIGIERDRAFVVSREKDIDHKFLNLEVTQLRCDAVRLGVSDGADCVGCDVKARYISGSGKQGLRSIIETLSSSREYEVKLWIGNTLLIFGLVISLHLPKRIRRQSSGDIQTARE